MSNENYSNLYNINRISMWTPKHTLFAYQ